MHTRMILLFGACLLGLAACGQDDLPPIPATPPIVLPPVVKDAAPQKKEAVKYVYRGDRFRDPFVSLASDATQSAGLDEISTPNISALTLKGLFDDGKQPVAIISGGSISYVLKGSRLYDNRNRLVKGITGIIKKESVLLIAPDKTTKELKLRDN